MCYVTRTVFTIGEIIMCSCSTFCGMVRSVSRCEKLFFSYCRANFIKVKTFKIILHWLRSECNFHCLGHQSCVKYVQNSVQDGKYFNYFYSNLQFLSADSDEMLLLCDEQYMRNSLERNSWYTFTRVSPCWSPTYLLLGSLCEWKC